MASMHSVIAFVQDSRITIGLSALKCVISILFSLSTNLDYLYCGSVKVRSCSSTGADTCQKHGIADDGYYGALTDCTVTQTATEVCHEWIFFTMTVLICNTAHYMYQIYSAYKVDHDIQYEVYEAIEADQFRKVYSMGFNSVVALLSWLELWVIAMSWSAIKIGVLCGQYAKGNPAVSAMDFALLMLFLEGYKINLALVIKKWKSVGRYALMYAFRLDLSVLSLLTLVLHVAMYLFVLAHRCCLLFVSYWTLKTSNSEIQSGSIERI